MDEVKFKTIAIAQAPEFIKDLDLSEEAVVETTEKVNALVNDSFLDEPTTQEGKDLRARVIDIMEKGPESPYFKNENDQPKFDFDQLRDDVSVPAVADIIKLLPNYEKIVLKQKRDDAGLKESFDQYNQLSLEVFKALNDRGVGIGEYKFVFESLKAIIGTLETIVMDQVNGHRGSIISQLLGAKNPQTGAYESGFATYESLVKLLKKVTDDSGATPAEAYHVEK